MTILTGNDSPESFAGGWEADSITGLGGDDSIYAWDGNDTLYGGSGNDMIYSGADDDLAYGGDGDDTVQGGAGDDSLYGGAGADWMVVNFASDAGSATAYGGAGNDEVMFFGGAGGRAYGGTGLDILQLQAVDENALTVDLAHQTLDGHGSYVGVTYAGFEALDIISHSGNDVILAGEANDRISVGVGDNLVEAGGGDDLVTYSTHGASTLDGGAGQDTLQVDAAGSSLYFIFDHFDGGLDDGQGSVITGFEAYVATGSIFDDIAVFDAGNDRFTGYAGADTAFGYDGRDALFGMAGNDSLDGGAGRDRLFGGADNDTLIGGSEGDFLGGGKGDDLLDGGTGDDRFRFLEGNDTATGGAGQDWFLFTHPTHGVATITDFATGIDQLRFTGSYLPGGLAAGALDPALLSVGAATGGAGQFVLIHDTASNTSTLVWDQNGDDPSGAVETYAIFEGDVTLSASDFVIL
jgi:Ca2+-binding RTX toxin-like protein